MEKNKTLRNRLKTAAIGLGGLAAIVGSTILAGCGGIEYIRKEPIVGTITHANTPGCFRETGPYNVQSASTIHPTIYQRIEYEMDCRLIVETDSGDTVHIKFSDSKVGHPPDIYYSEQANKAKHMANQLTKGRDVILYVKKGLDGHYHLDMDPNDYIIE